MTLLKAADADRFVKDPERGARLVLFFGPDPGGVAERADAITKHLIGDDHLAVIRIESDELGADPGRLADEAYGGSLFSGRRVVRLRAGGNRNLVPFLEPIIERPPGDAWIVIEAGDLRKTSPLRRLFETSRDAVAIGCYADNQASLGRMIDDEVRAAGLTIAPDARTALIDLLGADRFASRSEVQKLCLYARSAGTIDLADIALIVGDSAAFAVDDVVTAAALGELADLDRGARRLAAAGTQAATIAIAAERHFIQLHRLAAMVEAGTPISGVLQSMRPPPMLSRRAALERQLRLWSRPDLDIAVGRIGKAIEESRLSPGVATAILIDALQLIARRSRRARSA